MKYEKYLKQIATLGVDQIMYVHACTQNALGPQSADNVFDQIGYIHRYIWNADHSCCNAFWLKDALKVPKSFVEKSKRTTASAVYMEFVRNEKMQ